MRSSRKKIAECIKSAVLIACCFASCALHQCKAKTISSENEQPDPTRVVEQTQAEAPWHNSLRSLAARVQEMAAALGRKDVAVAANKFADRNIRVTKEECCQFLVYVAKGANAFRNSGHFQEADELSKLVTVVLVQLDEDRSALMATMLTLQGTIAVDCDRFAAARPLLLQALAIHIETDQVAVENASALWFILGQVEKELGSLDRAEEIFLEMLTKAKEDQSDLQPILLASLCEVHTLRGEQVRSRKYATEAAKLIMNDDYEASGRTSYVMSQIAISNARAGRIDYANELFESALETAKSSKGFLSVIVARRHKEFADILLLQGKVEKAREHLQQAIKVRTGLHGKDHATVRVLEDQLFKLPSNEIGPVLSLDDNSVLDKDPQEIAPAIYNE